MSTLSGRAPMPKVTQESGSEAAQHLADRSTVAVLIPCFNEEHAIGRVVADFKAALPGAAIYVYDNNSSDCTRERARAAGAIVRSEARQGKGFVVRRMFADIDADIYVLVDGDATYDAVSAPRLIARLIADQLDMVVGARVEQQARAYRPGHRFGNALLTGAVARLFGRRLGDMLSGYRVLTRRFVKSFPALSKGFEIETELTIHALELDVPVTEEATPYWPRPQGSMSKLHTLRDGWRIVRLAIRLYKDEHPLRFFGALAIALALLSLALGSPVVLEFVRTGFVPRLPTAILAASLAMLAALSAACGLILDTVTRGRREARRLAYLAASRRA
jgi:glycosyltransferase involved in cell wall biosynthesis